MFRMPRISIVGTSGSGKSRLARRLADELAIPLLELDSIRHQPNWEPLPDPDFTEQVSAFVAQDTWIVDGNYFDLATEPLIWPRADTVIWLDLPRSTVMRQLITRTLRRALRREELWNGNRERLRDVLRWDPNHSILRWSWTTHARNRQRYEATMHDPRWNHLTFVRLRTRPEIDSFGS